MHFRSIVPVTFGCVQSASILLLEGAVAQLGERLICIQEVAGSIPTSSTSLCLARQPFVRMVQRRFGLPDPASQHGPVAQVVRAHP